MEWGALINVKNSDICSTGIIKTPWIFSVKCYFSPITLTVSLPSLNGANKKFYTAKLLIGLNLLYHQRDSSSTKKKLYCTISQIKHNRFKIHIEWFCFFRLYSSRYPFSNFFSVNQHLWIKHCYENKKTKKKDNYYCL